MGHKDCEICLDVNMTGMGYKDSEINTRRGYGHPTVHGKLEECQQRGVRKHPRALIPPDVKVGAVRISATGWEGWILEGMKVPILCLVCESISNLSSFI